MEKQKRDESNLLVSFLLCSIANFALYRQLHAFLAQNLKHF